MRVRLAEMGDCEDVLDWRNDEATRMMSFNGDLIELSSHKEWFENVLKNDHRILVIGMEGNEKFGMVRFDNISDQFVVSINLNPRFRGRRLASKFLEKSEEVILKSWQSEKLLAKIKEENIVSVRTFERCGYVFVGNGIERGSKICIYEKKFS